MTKTTFRIAETADDRARCRQLLSANGLDELELQIPSVVALREGHLVGLLGTQKRDDAIVAGPLIMDLPKGVNEGFLILQMVELYENALRNPGA